MRGDGMTASDLAQHEALGIPEALLADAKIRRVSDEEARALLSSAHSGDLSGIVYPYIDPTTNTPVTHRVRRDHPEMEDGKPTRKYLSAYGDHRHLYFAPGVSPSLPDPKVPAVIVEAEKSVLAITAAAAQRDRPLVLIGTSGCWGWRGRIGKTEDSTGQRVNETGPLPDFNLLTWKDRDCILCFDGDAASNSMVWKGRHALATMLTDRGARVRLMDLPQEDGINGPDDFIGRHGAPAFFELLDAATPARRSHDQPVEELVAEFGLTMDVVPGYSVDALVVRLRKIREACAGADALRMKSVAHQLKTVSKVPAALVTAAFHKRDDPPATVDTGIAMDDDEPWPIPTDGAALLDETAQYFRKHVVLSDEGINAITLWTASLYALDAFELMPYLLLTSPVAACGKSTTLFAVECVVPRPINASSLTSAVLFRVMEKFHPTLLADEADAWLHDEKSELRGIFNAGHSRQTATVLRCVGDNYDVQMFNVFGPKAIAQIGKPAATILSRSIVVPLCRKRADEPVTHLRLQDGRRTMTTLRRKWRRWGDDHITALRAHTPDVPTALINRARDNWEPLLSIAALAGSGWHETAEASALALSGISDHDDEPVHTRLLADVRRVFDDQEEPHLSAAALIVHLAESPESEWADWNKGRGLSAAQLAKGLRGFGSGPGGLHTRPTRFGNKTGKRWHREDFKEAWTRYLPSDPPHPKHTNETGPQSPFLHPKQNGHVSAPEMPVSPMKPGRVSGVSAVAPADDPGDAISIVEDASDGTDTVLRNGCTRVLRTSNPPLAWVSPKAENDRLGAILQQPGCHFRVEGHSVTLTPDGALSESAAAYVADHADALRQRLLAMLS